MQELLRGERLKRRLDDLGLRALIMILAQGWFILLWGLGVPSVAAGLALGLLGQMTLTRYRRDTAIAREAALRRRIGGELALEELLLSPAAQAHRQAAGLLASAYPPLTVLEDTPHGARCRYESAELLVRCAAHPADSELSCDEIAAAARACRAVGADRAVLCLCCKCSPAAAAFADQLPVPVRLISRQTLLTLAGRAAPVTDAQLVALAARQKKLTPATLLRGALHRSKAKRYMTYGLGLMLLYIVTGLKYYPIPGALCLLLAVGCRCVREEPETL